MSAESFLPLDEKYRRWLENASESEIRLAAEAVVDAALSRSSASDDSLFSEEDRGKLVEAVIDNPTVTKDLFKTNLNALH